MSIIQSIQLKNFRSYANAKFSFEAGVNHIYGPNGLGKTNLLEAIFLLSTGRSFRSTNLSELIRHDTEAFQVEAKFQKDEVEQTLSISFDGSQKRIFHNGTSYSNFTQLLGMLPSVVYSPLDIFLISGSPSDRRRFLNLHIAQKDPLYVYHLGRYTRALKQRNALLKRKQVKTIEVWEEEMSKSAVYLMDVRKTAISELSSLLQTEFAELASKKHVPSITYLPSKLPTTAMREKELILGYTLVGPHRDDLVLTLDEKAAKSYASEGEKRLIIAALKLAAYRHLEYPLFAIDDFGNHLDDDRSDALHQRLKEFPQVFLTSPDKMPLDDEAHSLSLETACRF